MAGSNPPVTWDQQRVRRLTATFRSATRTDRHAIYLLILKARLFPLDLDWRRFVVAEEDAAVVAAGQIRPHRDGSLELASVVVAPEHRGRGLSRRLIQVLLRKQCGPVYLICRSELMGYYARLGFAATPPADVPLSIEKLRRIEDLASRLLTLVGVPRRHLVVMKGTPQICLNS